MTQKNGFVTRYRLCDISFQNGKYITLRGKEFDSLKDAKVAIDDSFNALGASIQRGKDLSIGKIK